MAEATEEWVVDGVNLSSLAYDITSRDGMDTVPALVGSNVSYAQSHGEKWVRKFYGPARKSLIMWVSPRDRITGVMGATLDDKRKNLDANIDYLTRLFGRRNSLLDVQRTLSDGTVRQADAEVVVAIDPVTVGLTDAKFGVELYIPSGFWHDLSSSTLEDLAVGSNQVLAGLAAATAPMTDLEFHIVGPATNPKVVDLESGSYFQYNDVVADGSTLVVKNTTMNITGGTLSKMVHDGETNWLTLYPTISGVKIDFTASSTTASTRLQIVGRKAFLR